MYTLKKQKSAQNFHTLHTNLVKLREREEERVIENFRERETSTRLRQRDHWCDEIETTRSAAPISFGSRTRTRSVTTAPMSNENEIGNDGADQLWVENENENDCVDDLGGTISAARTR